MVKSTNMIEIFIGEDTQTARKAIRKAIGRVLGHESAGAQRFTDVGFDTQAANEAIFAQNLFGEKNTVVFDGILDAPETEGFYSESMLPSPNNIFIRETKPNKDILVIFKKIGAVHDFPLIKKTKNETNFAIADAIAAREKKIAWVEFTKAKARGAAAEEIHGTIFWAIKLLYLCANCNKEEAIKAGVSPYNYSRYLTNSKKFLDTELEDRLRELKDMYHKAHRGEGDFDAMLEQYVLKA
ncbi:MAG: hypothetical protein UY04_C0010G0023 [Parcubacteria group bacterium GW2011_GWA2_47_7]|nr:MAG: hypothetical protein UY04_C0010G0023 [Parcubacteria group bacterium GW2011_GWA2_47_7]